jgi:hypothetical protein
MRIRTRCVLVLSLVVSMLVVSISAAFAHCEDMATCDLICAQPFAVSPAPTLAERSDRQVADVAWLPHVARTGFLPTPDPPPKALVQIPQS